MSPQEIAKRFSEQYCDKEYIAAVGTSHLAAIAKFQDGPMTYEEATKKLQAEGKNPEESVILAFLRKPLIPTILIPKNFEGLDVYTINNKSSSPLVARA